MKQADVTELLKTEFTKLKDELVKAYNNKGMHASGNWADSLEVVTDGTRAKILGLPYSQQLETGRKPGRQPPSKAIEQWIKDKGIANRIEGEVSVSSLAFLIARKIAKQGWNRQGRGGVNLISGVITPRRIQDIIDKAGQEQTGHYITHIKFDLKKLHHEYSI